MENKLEKLIKLPFRVAEAVSRPVADLVETAIGEDVDRFIHLIPGGKALDHATRGFNKWLTQDAGKSISVDNKEEEQEIVEPQ